MRVALPNPGRRDLERSLRLERQICREISTGKNTLSFERFMYLCLYAEDLGYYTSNHSIFGAQGDFVTSSERSHYYAMAFANHLKTIQSQLRDFYIIEVGAGSGRFAAQLLTALKRIDISIKGYYIIEKSAVLRRRQQEYLNKVLSEESSLVRWIDALDEPVSNAIVIANEVIDALPVRLLTFRDRYILERRVQRHPTSGFMFETVAADTELAAAVYASLGDLSTFNSQQPYCTEVCLQLADFVQQIVSLVQRGIFFFIDYGYPRAEYYHAQRDMGTLLCHYKNVAHDDPLLWPGLQDISSNVDFTALANAGISAGLELNSYSTQAHFLLASDILSSVESETSQQVLLHHSQQLKYLMLPSEMGERFQVMTFTKNMTLNRDQFTVRDLSHRL